MKQINKITLAITGASGANYAIRLLEELIKQNIEVFLLISEAAKVVLQVEHNIDLTGNTEELTKKIQQLYPDYQHLIKIFASKDWFAPVASGSNTPETMVVCPCSSGTLAAIASGASNNLIERAADVILKEKKQLIIVPREMPYNQIHLENMLKLAKLNVTIMPASPAFYHQPKTINHLIDFVVSRILDHIGLENQLIARWSK